MESNTSSPSPAPRPAPAAGRRDHIPARPSPARDSEDAGPLARRGCAARLDARPWIATGAAALAVALAGCGGSSAAPTQGPSTVAGPPSASTPPAGPPPPSGYTGASGAAALRATARSGGLTVTLDAAPARSQAGTAVEFTATAYERRATGALVHRLRYGDGAASAPIAVPQICAAGAGAPARRAWRFTHRYRTPGRYTASLTVGVNCGRDRATVAVTVTILSRGG